MPTLSTYLTQTQRLLHDVNAEAYSTTDLTAYINEGRNQLALESESVRFLYGGQGWTITGTTNGTTTVSAVSSTQGLAVGQFLFGTNIASGATIATIGVGSFTMSIAATGSGSVTIAVQPANLTVVGQEVYPYPATGASLALPLGIDGIVQVKSVAVNWGGTQGSQTNQNTLYYIDFTRYQAKCRTLGLQDLGQQYIWTNYNQQVWTRKIPSQVVGMQWDSACSVTALTGAATDVDALMSPWNDAVKFYAAYLAFLNAQRFDDSDKMFQQYVKFANRARTFAQRSMQPNVYLSF